MINSPMCTGCRKCRLSTEAVTTGLRACRMAAMAAARSTRCMTLPPSTLPRPLASLGSASSEYSRDRFAYRFAFHVLSDAAQRPRLPIFAAGSSPRRRAPAGRHGLRRRRGWPNARRRRILQRAVGEGMMIALQHVVEAQAVGVVAREMVKRTASGRRRRESGSSIRGHSPGCRGAAGSLRRAARADPDGAANARPRHRPAAAWRCGNGRSGARGFTG